MDVSPQPRSFSSLSNSDLDNSELAMSPVTNLTHILSSLCTTPPRTPSGESQNNWFAETRRSSAVSIRSSVFTNDEVDVDEDTMFAVDKFLEDEESAEMSKSMSHILTSPLSVDSDPLFKKLRVAASEPRKAKGSELPTRRCLHISFTSTPVSSRGSIDAETGGEASKADEKKSEKFVSKRVKSLDCGIKCARTKRKRSPPLVTIPLERLPENKNQATWSRCYSETGAMIMQAEREAVMLPELIGDGSKFFTLPLIHGRHPDLKAINSETLAKLLKGELGDFVKDFLVVDCRYPYEYDGGHIAGAKNIYTKDGIYNTLLPGTNLSLEMHYGRIIIFHCEFSSKRAPKLLRFLREEDRNLNKDAYPRLYHPEIYLLEGGYKAFYAQFKELCEPQAYKPMLHKSHAEELQKYEKEMRKSSRK